MQPHWHGLAAGKIAIKQKTFVKPKRKVKKEFDTAVQKSVIRPCPLATAKGCGLKGHGANTHAHTHTYMSRAMSITVKYLVRLKGVVLWL